VNVVSCGIFGVLEVLAGLALEGVRWRGRLMRDRRGRMQVKILLPAMEEWDLTLRRIEGRLVLFR
jgi:hypothetical protein